MRKLQIEQCFENIQTTYNQPSITWLEECAGFWGPEGDPTTGHLKVWQDEVTPEQIFTEVDCLERKIEQFLLAMQLMDNDRMRKNGKPSIKYYAKDGQEFEISKNEPGIVKFILQSERGESVIYGSIGMWTTDIRGEFKSLPVSFPSTLQQASLGLQRLIGIFTSAQDFTEPYRVDYPLRNYYSIMEELIEHGIPKPTFYDDLKKVRNFIIHSRANGDDTKAFIESKFPEAIINKNGKKYAQFDRTKDSHINFIWSYRDQAYFWVKEQLALLSKSENTF